MPQLTRLVLSLPPDHSADAADLLLALLALHVPHGWEEQSLPTGEIQCIVHSGHPGFCIELTTMMQEAHPLLKISSSVVEEENWVEAWKEFFTPVEGGTHFLVLAPWMEEERKTTTRIPIIIEPKTAFGTGHHATTSLCLDAISAMQAEGRLAPGMKFLDLGTGSGILGIACAKLGLKGEGLDIDVAAVDNAVENRDINGVAAADFPVERGGVEAAKGPYDLVLANILAEPLKTMAPQIVACLARKGEKHAPLVLSGMLDIQAQGVEDVYTALGLAKPRRLLRGEWVALVFE